MRKYDVETRRKIYLANLDSYDELPELVRRAEAGERLGESGVAPEYDEAARAYLLLANSSLVPDSITNALFQLLDFAAEETGAGLWMNADDNGGLEDADYSQERCHHDRPY